MNLRTGASVAAASNLFPRMELPKEEPAKEEKAKKQKPAVKPDAAQSGKSPAIQPSSAGGGKQPIEFADFQKIDLRVGTILAAEKHPSADKLLVFQIKVGTETRQIVSGIAKWYRPEDLVGKKVAFIANLKPVVLRGVESQGMLLSAEGADGTLELVTLNEVEDGASIH